MPTVTLHPTTNAASTVVRPTRAIDPDEEALRSVVSAIANNCIFRNTTSRDEIQSVVEQFRVKYPGLTVDLVQGAVFVLEASLAAASRVPLCGAAGGASASASGGAGKKRGRISDGSESSSGAEGKTKWRKSTCKHEGCEKWAQRRGLCISHGGTKEQCQFEDCKEAAFLGQGLCAVHGGVQPLCAAENCGAHVSRDGLRCQAHSGGGGGGGKSEGKDGGKRRTCRAEGCNSHRKRGGYCWKHGASRMCGRPGCPNQARREGVCGKHYCATHGEKCTQGGCTFVAAMAEAASDEEVEMAEVEAEAPALPEAVTAMAV